jgi:hypothetical protein
MRDVMGGGGAGGAAGTEGAGAAGAASSLACGARSIDASPGSPGPSRYGFGSPCSAAGRGVRGPRPRRGGRRRSFMQVLSVRVNARESRVRVLAEISMRTLRSRRRGGNAVSQECLAAYAAGRSVDDGNRATRLVLCLDRLPARIPHAGSGNGPTRGRGAHLASCTPGSGTLVRPRIDARSVDAERCRTDGRNEYGQLFRFAQPTRLGCELHARVSRPVVACA